jgi:Tfp pilus assembly protein PilO
MIPRTLTEYHRYSRYFKELPKIYQKKETVVYTGLILTLLSVSFFAVFAIRPTIITIVSLYREIQTQKEINNQLQKKINTLSSAQSNYTLAEPYLPLIDEAIPPTPSLSQVTLQFETLAQKNNLTINSLSFEPSVLLGKDPTKKEKKKTSSLQNLSFSLSLNGNFEDLEKFLDSLSQLRRIITIDSSSFSKKESTEGEETETINLNISGKFYFLE